MPLSLKVTVLRAFSSSFLFLWKQKMRNELFYFLGNQKEARSSGSKSHSNPKSSQ